MNARVCELSSRAAIRFSGADAQSFLHNQLTCDVAALAPGASTYGACCTPKGRMLASFLLWRAGDAFLMQLPAALREPTQKHLAKFVLRSKVTVADASADTMLIGVAGKDAAALVRRTLGGAPSAVHEVMHARRASVIRLPGDRYEVATAMDGSTALLDELCSGAGKADQEYWDWLDIRAGIPVILPETREEFVPQMANLDLIGGVSFSKGCYPGQEIVARMHYRGTLKQRMYLASIATEDPPRPGDKLYSPAFGGQSCGTLVNAARSPEGGHDVLAVVQIAAAEAGGVRWKSPAGPVLKLLNLPYAVAAPA